MQVTVPIGAEEFARHFYTTVLELTEIPRPPEVQKFPGFWMKAGSSDVHFGTEDHDEKDLAKAHLAYQVSDMNYWRKKLESHNIQIIETFKIMGAERLEFHDPFGNHIEFIQPPK